MCLLTGSSGGPITTQKAAWDDRIARNLSLTFHEQRIEKYERLYEKGLHAKNGEFDNVPKEQIERLMKLMMGSALKENSKQLRRNTELPAITGNTIKTFLSHIRALTPHWGYAYPTVPVFPHSWLRKVCLIGFDTACFSLRCRELRSRPLCALLTFRQKPVIRVQAVCCMIVQSFTCAYVDQDQVLWQLTVQIRWTQENKESSYISIIIARLAGPLAQALSRLQVRCHLS